MKSKLTPEQGTPTQLLTSQISSCLTFDKIVFVRECTSKVELGESDIAISHIKLRDTNSGSSQQLPILDKYDHSHA